MSSNEYTENTEDQEQNQFATDADTKSSKKTKKSASKKGAEKSVDRSGGRMVVQIMNGEFLSRDWFIRNLPFTFYIGLLLVVLIGWGYYGDATTRKEIQLQEQMSELNSEYFTLSSEYISKRGRTQIKKRLQGSGLQESRVSPRKIRVKRYVFR
jgi:Bacteriodetes cell division protein (FtsL-like)